MSRLHFRFAPIAVLLTTAVLSVTVAAKLPPLDAAGKAKAVDTAARAAWTEKVGLFQLCKVTDRTAEHYRKTALATGKAAPAPIETPPCADPGAYVAPPEASPMAAAAAASVPSSAPPIESSEAHSPAKTSVGPPSTNATAAEQQGASKK